MIACWVRSLGVTIERDVSTPDGRVVHAYDTEDPGVPVFWHHGTPNIGAPPVPLFADARRLGLRWVSYDRPGYGGSPARPGRDIGSAAADVTAVADALGLDRFAVVGHSGGGPHALACAVLLDDRVLAAVSLAGLAPYNADGLDWYAGMAASGQGALQAAAMGRDEKIAYEETAAPYDPEFTDRDQATLAGEWGWLGTVVNAAMAGGPDGAIDDDVAYVNPWGFDVTEAGRPILLAHGGRDRVVPSSHTEWLARRCRPAELLLSTQDGHISILNQATTALEWLRSQVG
jgi:pimeloyl-ACP methyl ester carboxylesterase